MKKAVAMSNGFLIYYNPELLFNQFQFVDQVFSTS